jgi:hypothetical protein
MDYKYDPFLEETSSYFIAYEEFKEHSESRFNALRYDEDFEIFGHEWEESEREKLALIFDKEYSHLAKERVYFYGCPIEVYVESFPKRLQSFLDEFPDGNENYFCDYELTFEKNYIMSSAMRNKMKYSLKRRIEFLKEKISESQKQIVDQDSIYLNNTSSTSNIYLGQPSNDKANELFDYLIENYRSEENSKVKFVNILHYLKNDVPKDLYIFNLKQVQYKEVIDSRFGVYINKFSKSEKYDENEKPILNSLLNGFSRSKNQ